MSYLRWGFVMEAEHKHLFGNDPGFASFGLVVYDLTIDEFVDGGVLRTKKDGGKVKATEDNLRRARELHGELVASAEPYNVVAICAEAMSYARHASASHKIGIAWGVVASLGVPVIQQSPQAIKKHVCGKISATKEQVRQAMLAKHPELARFEPKQKTLFEHYYDAAAAVLACLNTEQGRILRNLI